MKLRQLVFCTAICAACCIGLSASGQQAGTPTRTATEQLYAAYGGTDFWSGQGEELRVAVLHLADSAARYGLNRNDYNFPAVTSPAADRTFTVAALSLLRDLHQGRIDKHVSNDEVAHAFRGHTDSVIVQTLLKARDTPGVLLSLIPAGSHHVLLGRELLRHSSHADTVRQLAASANLYRWIAHFGFDKYIVINIPSATMKLYDHDTVRLQMKVVVGKPSTRTPRFSSWLDKVILYPYWNVPYSIATKELLPIFRRSPAKVAAMNMQVLDKRGRILDPYTLNWQSFNRNYFPYTIRQCTGCDNALGVIKFNLTDPFHVYMHDTNNKPAFMSDYRYLSHGCIRLSDPVSLGNALLDNKLDTAFLAACFKNEDPEEIPLAKPVPVFVVYMTAEAVADSIIYHRDIYRLFR